MPQALLGFIVGVCALVYIFPFPTPHLLLAGMIKPSAVAALLAGLLGGVYYLYKYSQHQHGIKNHNRHKKNNRLSVIKSNLSSASLSTSFAYSRLIFTAAYFLIGVVLGIIYANWHLNHALQARLIEPTETTALVKVIGISDGLDEQWRQVVEVVNPENQQKTSASKKSARWLLYAQVDWKNQKKATPPDMQAGQVWQVTVKLKPAHSNASFGAFDVEKWLLQQHIVAVGTLQNARLLSTVERTQQGIASSSMLSSFLDRLNHERERIRQHFMQFKSPAKGVLLGLLTGDRSLIDGQTTLQYQQMGISHLLAISGPHVLLAALIITWLLRQLLDRVPKLYLLAERRRWLLPIFLTMVLLYAGLAGFDIPAQRTVLMVTLLTVVLWFRGQASAIAILLISATALLLFDPLIVLSAAFWLSFGAVAILMTLKRPVASITHASNLSQKPDAKPAKKPSVLQPHVANFVGLQWRLFVLLAPLVLLCFAKISWLAPVINLLAIPLLSVVVLPLNLLGYGLFICSPVLADGIWQCALAILTGFHAVLNQLSVWFPQALQPFYLSNIQLAALFAMLGLLLLPKGMLPKWWLLFLLLAVVYPARHTAPLTVQVLDVGQGLSVLLKTAHHAMVVDTGVKTPNGTDMGEKVVLPAVQAQGITRLDKLMLTHLDNDHSGGAESVLQHIPVMQLSSSETFGKYPTHLCEAGQSWQWDGVIFTVLAPLPQHHQQTLSDKNESSCVLMVKTPATQTVPSQHVLIMGDAGFYTEFLLLQQSDLNLNPDQALNADLLILGHHGSKHSSSSLFLHTVAPQRAVVSAGYLNRYQHPTPVVLARLAEQGIAVDSTIDSGTLTYYLGEKSVLQPERYREQKSWLKRDLR